MSVCGSSVRAARRPGWLGTGERWGSLPGALTGMGTNLGFIPRVVGRQRRVCLVFLMEHFKHTKVY